MISVRAMSAAASRPSSFVAAIDAITTGDALMFRADTSGSTLSGKPALAMLSSMAACVSFTSVPNENWATTSATEFAEVDCRFSSRGTPAMARSMGSATWLATSVAEAPGRGATTVITGKSMSGRSSC